MAEAASGRKKRRKKEDGKDGRSNSTLTSEKKRKSQGEADSGSGANGSPAKRRRSQEGDGKQGDGGNQSSSRRKREIRKERQSLRKHADVVREAKEVWNKLRVKANSKADTVGLATKLCGLLEGKVQEIAMQHDASRVVQAAIQFGTESQRKDILKELTVPHPTNERLSILCELSKYEYSHFVVLKVLRYCNRDQGSMRNIVKSFKGQVPGLAVHAVGARVIEILFSTFPPKLTVALKMEFYGPHFGLFSDEVAAKGSSREQQQVHPTLTSVLAGEDADKKKSAMKFVLDFLNKGMEKSLYTFAFFQTLFCEYVMEASPNNVRDVCGTVVDHSIHFLSTRKGARVVAECATYATSKDRKRIAKSLRGYVRQTLLHRDGYIALLRLMDVTDDTVHITNNLLTELQEPPTDNQPDVFETEGKKLLQGEDDGNNEEGPRPKKKAQASKTHSLSEPVTGCSPILDVALSDTGSKLFLLLLSDTEEERQKHFDPSELEILRSNCTVVDKGEEVPTSRKNPSTRRLELLRFLRPLLHDLCESRSDTLLRSKSGSKVLREFYRSFPSSTTASAVVEACWEGAKLESDNDQNCAPLFEHPVGHLAVKNMILLEVEMSSQKFGAGSQADYDEDQVMEEAETLENQKSFGTSRGDSLGKEPEEDDQGGDGSCEFFIATGLFEKFHGQLMEKIGRSSRGAFVLSALATVPSLKDRTVKELVSCVDKIRDLATPEEDLDDRKSAAKKVFKRKVTAGYEALVKILSPDMKKD